ncbi:hypothetical protein [Sphingomonas glacialis]|uniref:hypothetical protein n=1 Tax=Sphingomonas glacialis TaxID=658225 RepID=UPI001127CB55|nr:hypothetical protein [Sphingomonas glacialis]
MENRLRATSAAAAAPNSRTIGGAGTGAGGPPGSPGVQFAPQLLLLLLLPWPQLLLEFQPWLLEP